MTVFPPGSFYFMDAGGGPSLHRPIQQWVGRNPYWACRVSTVEGEYRRSTVNEVAEVIVQDPTMLQVLGTLASPSGQAIERAALSQWMSPEDAALMTAALTRAWKLIRNQNVPVWKRADVLVGTVVVLLFVGCVVMAARPAKKENGHSASAR